MASASSSTAPSTKPKPRKSKPNSNQPPPPPPQPKSELPLLRYPPFPPIPPDVEIVPYSQFKEHGIRLYGLPSVEENAATSSDIEVDGLGIPTAALKVRHETDSCKTFTRGRERSEDLSTQKRAKSSPKESAAEPAAPVTKKDPVARALQLRQQRVLLFAKKEWFEQWAEGEANRGTVYDSNSTIVDRIHHAANDFRKGRVWPLASSRLAYLWDQFRLYVGLLGQPPVWYRTDLQQNPDDVVDDIEGDDDALFDKVAASRTQDEKKEKSILDDDFYDEDSEDDGLPQTQPTSNSEETQDKPAPRKRIPPRTPYALYNVVPVALSSESQVKTLLSIASVRKYQKLETFIYTPDTSLRIFFSWYLHYQGFAFSPSYLANLPRLVLFFLELLLRTRAVYENERALKAAVEVTKKAITEVPAAGRMCRLLPEKMGVGCTLIWGRRWVGKDQPFEIGVDKDKAAEEAKQEALRQFEEELKKENVQVVSAEGIPPPEELFKGPEGTEEDPDDLDSKAEISIQILSPTSPGFSNLEEMSSAIIEEVIEEGHAKPDDRNKTQTQKVEEEIISSVQESSSSQGTAIPTRTPDSTTEPIASTHATSMPEPESEMNESIPSRWDTASDEPPSQDKSRQVWASKVCQPLMELFGMTALPLKYKPGVAERSMRRVKEVVPAGGRSKEAGMERKWRGLQRELVGKLARVVLEPWLDWDDGGIAAAYRKPRVQIPQEEKQGSAERGRVQDVPEGEDRQQGVEERSHDLENDVVLLVEPRVAEQISVGMGLAGTWIKMVRVEDYRKEAGLSTADMGEGSGQRSTSYGRGRGRGGRGRGRGRGGAASAGNEVPIDEADPDPTANQDANDSLPKGLSGSKDETAEPEHRSSSPGNRTTSTRGGQRGGRGSSRGRGRGGGYYRPQRQAGGPEEFAFWYVEDIFMAVPSFWMAGKEEEPIQMPEGEEELGDVLSDLED